MSDERRDHLLFIAMVDGGAASAAASWECESGMSSKLIAVLGSHNEGGPLDQYFTINEPGGADRQVSTTAALASGAYRSLYDVSGMPEAIILRPQWRIRTWAAVGALKHNYLTLLMEIRKGEIPNY